MVRLVIKGKVIELISVLHLHLSVEESYVVYYDCEDGEDHTLHFGEDDLDELIIKRTDVAESNIAPAAVQQQEQC